MTRDYLVGALTQLEGEHKKSSDQLQALNGAIQAVKQLIQAEDTNAKGGTLPDQGITGPPLG